MAESLGDIVDATRRTHLAAERTYLAWWRTALTAFAVSIAVGKVVPELAGGASIGYELVGVGYAVVGISFLGYGFHRQRRQEIALKEGRFESFPTSVALVLALAGVALGAATIVVVLI
jgi:putative membrane protein